MSKKTDDTIRVARETCDKLSAERDDLVAWIADLESRPGQVDLSRGARAAASGLAAVHSELDAAREVLASLDKSLERAHGILDAARQADVEEQVTGLRDEERVHWDALWKAAEEAARCVEALNGVAIQLRQRGAYPRLLVNAGIWNIPVALKMWRTMQTLSRPLKRDELLAPVSELVKESDPILALANSIRERVRGRASAAGGGPAA